MLRIAILTPFHSEKGIGMLERQVCNYSHYLRDVELLFIFHPSTTTPRVNESRLASALVSPNHRIVLTSSSIITSQNGSSNSIPLLWATLRSCLFFQPDYVLYRTSSDLLIKTGIPSLMHGYDFAVNAKPLNVEHSKWGWIDHLKQDPRVRLLLDILCQKAPRLYLGRIECSFYRYDLWVAMMEIIDRVILAESSFFSNPKNHWPVEEILLPTISRTLGENLGLSNYGRSLCFTKNARLEGRISLKDIEALRSEGLFYSAKRFSASTGDPAVRELTEFNK